MQQGSREQPRQAAVALQQALVHTPAQGHAHLLLRHHQGGQQLWQLVAERDQRASEGRRATPRRAAPAHLHRGVGAVGPGDHRLQRLLQVVQQRVHHLNEKKQKSS